MKKVTREDVAFGAYLAGIREGDIVLMHSALSSVGNVEGGADAIIDGLMDVIGENGALAVSTLTHYYPKGPRYDKETTPTNVGIIAETLRQRPGAARSLNPTHSIAAIGGRAEELCADHEKCATVCGEGSPYTKLRDLGGKVALLGVDMNRNTTLHSLEDLEDCSYLETRPALRPTYMEGDPEEPIILEKFPPGHRDFLHFTQELRKIDALREASIGNAIFKVIDAKEMFRLGREFISKDMMYFMCRNENCAYCTNARAKQGGAK